MLRHVSLIISCRHLNSFINYQLFIPCREALSTLIYYQYVASRRVLLIICFRYFLSSFVVSFCLVPRVLTAFLRRAGPITVTNDFASSPHRPSFTSILLAYPTLIFLLGALYPPHDHVASSVNVTLQMYITCHAFT